MALYAVIRDKERAVSTLIETLILYLIFFLPGIRSYGTYPAVIAFSIHQELIRLFVYTIPALALILYLHQRPVRSAICIPKPRLTDLRVLMLCLPGLILLGFGVSILSALTAVIFADSFFIPLSPHVEAPGSPPAWLAMAISCLGTGYLEESYFRFYLLSRLEDAGIGKGKSIFFSTLLFSCCHIYEGPWGILNAALAGLGLSVVFVKYRSLHGIAWAHGGYNGFVYILSGW